MALRIREKLIVEPHGRTHASSVAGVCQYVKRDTLRLADREHELAGRPRPDAGQLRGVRFFFVEDFSPYSWALFPRMRLLSGHFGRGPAEVPHRSLTTEVPSATGPSAAPHHALTDPIASYLAAAGETDWAANEEEPHPSWRRGRRRNPSDATSAESTPPRTPVCHGPSLRSPRLRCAPSANTPGYRRRNPRPTDKTFPARALGYISPVEIRSRLHTRQFRNVREIGCRAGKLQQRRSPGRATRPALRSAYLKPRLAWILLSHSWHINRVFSSV